MNNLQIFIDNAQSILYWFPEWAITKTETVFTRLFDFDIDDSVMISTMCNIQTSNWKFFKDYHINFFIFKDKRLEIETSIFLIYLLQPFVWNFTA